MAHFQIVVTTYFYLFYQINGIVFVKLVRNCMRSFLIKYDVLTACQIGFRNEKCTVDAILELTEQLVENLKENDGSVCTLKDLTKAFDTVDHKLLLKKCVLYGL